MPPRNDIFRVSDLKWSHCEPYHDILAKVDYIEQTDKGLKIHCKVEKEKKMNKNEELKNVDTIIITRRGNTVSVEAYEVDSGVGYPVVRHKTIAECSPDDIFDFNIGAKLAFDRLYEGYDMTPKPKRKPYNGIIRVVWNEDRFDSFEVVDGKLYSRVYVLRLPCQQKYIIYEDSSFEDMKQALLNSASFIWNDGKPPMAICRDNVTHRL